MNIITDSSRMSKLVYYIPAALALALALKVMALALAWSRISDSLLETLVYLKCTSDV